MMTTEIKQMYCIQPLGRYLFEATDVEVIEVVKGSTKYQLRKELFKDDIIVTNLDFPGSYPVIYCVNKESVPRGLEKLKNHFLNKKNALENDLNKCNTILSITEELEKKYGK